MNSEPQPAYLNLIHELLTCPTGEEAEILKSHPDLLDDGLVAAMLEEADNLREKGEVNNADWLKNFAGLLGKVDGDFLAGIALKAEADRLFEQGNQQDDISQFREALQSWEQALTIYQKIGNRQGEAASLGNSGIAYDSLGQYKEAIEFYKQSLAIKQNIGDRPGEAASFHQLGNAYYSLRQYDLAIEFHKYSLNISHQIGDRLREAASLCNLGSAYGLLGEYNRAIEFHKNCLKISKAINDCPGEAASLNNLGLAYHSLGQHKEAIEFYEQSLLIKRKVKNRKGEAASLDNLGLAYKSLGQYQKAIDFHEQSLVIDRKIGNRSGEAASLCNLGLAYYSLGSYHKALHFYEQSLVISRKIGQREWQANSLSNLGLAYYQMSNGLRIRYTNAPKFLAFFLKKPLIFFEIYFSQESEAKLRESIQISENIRSQLVNNDHKVSIFETQRYAYRLLQQVLVAQAKFDEALEISEMGRTRAFVELLQQNLLTTDLATNEITNTLSIPRIQQIAQQKNSTIVEYSIIDPDIYIWVIEPNGNITHRAANLKPLNQQNQSLKQIILKARVSIGVDETDDEGNEIQMEPNSSIETQRRLLKLLYQILIEPIADLLPTDPNTPIIFIPHYELFLVPFTALQSANNRYLIEDHTILTAPSIQVLEQTSQHQQNIKGLRQAALIVGDPTIAAKFQENPYNLPQLPRAKEAAEAIAAILGTTAISGENATKAAILDQMLNTRIVHLSAHGLLDDFQGSGIPGTIILAASGDTDDGALNAAEILQLKLNSELVVLSACSTGRGKITGDGVNGLSRCFILAGVPSIIVSLWNMGSISAKLLMTEFYQNLARGDNRAAALRCAMLTTKKRFPSPIAWAAFTLIGETASLSLETQQIDLRRLKMSLPDDIKPEEIVAALSKLLKISDPNDLFAENLSVAEHLSALDVSSTDNVNIVAQKIRDWCETRPELEENLENEIYQQGARGTSSYTSEKTVNDFIETLQGNQTRLRLSLESVPVVETDNSGTRS